MSKKQLWSRWTLANALSELIGLGLTFAITGLFFSSLGEQNSVGSILPRARTWSRGCQFPCTAVLQSDGQRAAEGKSGDQVLDEMYSGAKPGMRPIHEKLMKEITRFGAFEILPKRDMSV